LGIYDVPARHLIEETVGKLKEEIEEPEFIKYVKSGMHRERAPHREDWFYVRMASILYRAYKWNVISVEGLRMYYGGRKRNGVRTEHHKKASGKVIRTAIQKLEEKGYLEKGKPKGRKLSSNGFKLLNEISKIVTKNMEEGKYKIVKKVRQEKEKVMRMDNRKKEETNEKDKKSKTKGGSK
jgi:small subunit ribosomal protein S19e